MSDWWERQHDTRFRLTMFFFERIYAPIMLLALGLFLLMTLVVGVAALVTAV